MREQSCGFRRRFTNAHLRHKLEQLNAAVISSVQLLTIDPHEDRQHAMTASLPRINNLCLTELIDPQGKCTHVRTFARRELDPKRRKIVQSTPSEMSPVRQTDREKMKN
jgi:hypothetical protein